MRAVAKVHSVIPAIRARQSLSRRHRQRRLLRNTSSWFGVSASALLGVLFEGGIDNVAEYPPLVICCLAWYA